MNKNNEEINIVDIFSIFHTFFKSWRGIMQDAGLKGVEMQTLMTIAHFHDECINETKKEQESFDKINTEPVTVGAIAAKMELSLPATSQKISALEEHGYIERTFSKNDKRVTCVKITQNGEKQIKEIHDKIKNLLKKSIAEFGNENTNNFMQLTKDFCTILNNTKQEEEPQQC